PAAGGPPAANAPAAAASGPAARPSFIPYTPGQTAPVPSLPTAPAAVASPASTPSWPLAGIMKANEPLRSVSVPDVGPAGPQDSPLRAAGKVIANLPSSALNFAINTAKFLNPLNTAKTAASIGTPAGEALNEGDNPAALVKNTVLGLPEAAYQTLVPQFIQHIISGNFQQAASAIENDPVGQIAPLVLLGRTSADAAGVGDQFDSAVSTAAKPVTSTAGAATSKVSGGIGNLAAQLAGM